MTSAPTTFTSEKYLVALATKDMSGCYWRYLPQVSVHIFSQWILPQVKVEPDWTRVGINYSFDEVLKDCSKLNDYTKILA